MSFFRSLSATLLSATTSFSLVTASGCGTSAVGVDDCRDIEQARCRAGKACGIVEDVQACERYYRDHCLHGLATAPPAGASVASCVQVIEAAGQCAKLDPEAALADCEPGVPEPQSGLATACDVIRHPERAAECAFLTDVPPDEDGSGGQSGAGGREGTDEPASGGQAGMTGDAAQGGSSE
jgi:hypothetical protein